MTISSPWLTSAAIRNRSQRNLPALIVRESDRPDKWRRQRQLRHVKTRAGPCIAGERDEAGCHG
jgi:hypothetical protein